MGSTDSEEGGTRRTAAASRSNRPAFCDRSVSGNLRRIRPVLRGKAAEETRVMEAGGAGGGRSSTSAGTMPGITLPGYRRRPARPTGCLRKRDGNMPAGPVRRAGIRLAMRSRRATSIMPIRVWVAPARSERIQRIAGASTTCMAMFGSGSRMIGTNYQAAPTDGSPWKDAGTSPDTRLCVLRGGSWHILSRYCRSAYRMRSRIGIRYSGVGFRVARTLS